MFINLKNRKSMLVDNSFLSMINVYQLYTGEILWLNIGFKIYLLLLLYN